MTDYGSEVSSFAVNDDGEADLDPFFLVIDGVPATAEGCARRLLTPNGALPWDVDAGFDVGQWINADLDRAAALPIQSSAEVELLKDERVLEADVTVQIAARGLSVAVDAVGAEGPFSLVVDATGLAAKVAAITQGG
jgi:hypothetical protein